MMMGTLFHRLSRSPMVAERPRPPIRSGPAPCTGSPRAGHRGGISLDNLSPHRSIHTDGQVELLPAANNVEFAYAPFHSSWLNRIEIPFTGLRHFTFNGTDFGSHQEQGRMIRRRIAWCNNHTADPKLRTIAARTSITTRAKTARERKNDAYTSDVYASRAP